MAVDWVKVNAMSAEERYECRIGPILGGPMDGETATPDWGGKLFISREGEPLRTHFYAWSADETNKTGIWEYRGSR